MIDMRPPLPADGVQRPRGFGTEGPSSHSGFSIKNSPVARHSAAGGQSWQSGFQGSNPPQMDSLGLQSTPAAKDALGGNSGSWQSGSQRAMNLQRDREGV